MEMQMNPLFTSRNTRYSLLGATLLRRELQTSALFQDRLLSVTEAREALGGLTSATLRRWIRAGHLHAIRVGKLGHYKIPAGEIRRLIGGNDVREL
jgi:excisionase family DNA binding protein